MRTIFIVSRAHEPSRRCRRRVARLGALCGRPDRPPRARGAARRCSRRCAYGRGFLDVDALAGTARGARHLRRTALPGAHPPDAPTGLDLVTRLGMAGVRSTAFVVVVCVMLPLALVGVEALFRRLRSGLGDAVHVLLLTMHAGLFLLPFLRRVDALDGGPLLAVAFSFAACAAVGGQRIRVVGAFLTALGPAAIVVPVVFSCELRYPERGPSNRERARSCPRRHRAAHRVRRVRRIPDQLPAGSQSTDRQRSLSAPCAIG